MCNVPLPPLLAIRISSFISMKNNSLSICLLQTHPTPDSGVIRKQVLPDYLFPQECEDVHKVGLVVVPFEGEKLLSHFATPEGKTCNN